MHLYLIAAIAELLDNAVDEINNGATFVKVDRVYSKRDNSPALLFLGIILDAFAFLYF
ncbi:hypothetical protein M8C21_010745 [Ambrosia artemisiifolia]|uniref:Uncharacterized protein n=1 Tax=Ambrosia artemisiifolia TaxID=4212 RepID=A0AAD5CD25_AMBAR|nr:hypothetical protein M8C21_010745 [Ambrosia artemisiifolia]